MSQCINHKGLLEYQLLCPDYLSGIESRKRVYQHSVFFAARKVIVAPKFLFGVDLTSIRQWRIYGS